MGGLAKGAIKDGGGYIGNAGDHDNGAVSAAGFDLANAHKKPIPLKERNTEGVQCRDACVGGLVTFAGAHRDRRHVCSAVALRRSGGVEALVLQLSEAIERASHWVPRGAGIRAQRSIRRY